MSNNNLASKQELASSFGRAAKSYDEAAHLQKVVGARLLDYLKTHWKGSEPNRMVDLGCGTGFFAESLVESFGPANLVCLDISEDMLTFTSQRIDKLDIDVASAFLVSDAERLGIQSSSVELIFSSLALQWADDLQRALVEAHRVLKPGGVIAYSTLLDGTLFELKEAWASVDSRKHVNSFLSLDLSVEIARLAGFTLEVSICEDVVLEYDKPIQLMRDLKSIGAHNMAQGRSKGLTGKSKIAKVSDVYEKYRRADGFVPATYRAGYFVLKKGELA